MTSEDTETEFERRLRALLIESTEDLSGQVRSRLTQARHAALDKARNARRAPQSWQRWAPAGAAASVVLLALVFTGGHFAAPGPVAATASLNSPIDDLELLADSDAFEMTQEQQPAAGPASDFDFYEWAAGESGGSNGGKAGT